MNDAEANEEASITYSLRVGLRARRDLNEAIARIAQLEGDEAGRQFDIAAALALASLATSPRRYAIPPDVTGFAGEVRGVVFRRTEGSAAYRLIYRVAEDPDEGPRVTLLHVRHAAAKPIAKKEAREIEAQNRE